MALELGSRLEVVNDKEYKLIVIGHRVPNRGELYVNKNSLLQRRKEESYSRRAQKRVIVREAWVRRKR